MYKSMTMVEPISRLRFQKVCKFYIQVKGMNPWLQTCACASFLRRIFLKNHEACDSRLRASILYFYDLSGTYIMRGFLSTGVVKPGN
jgi:hypothetical protein